MNFRNCAWKEEPLALFRTLFLWTCLYYKYITYEYQWSVCNHRQSITMHAEKHTISLLKRGIMYMHYGYLCHTRQQGLLWYPCEILTFQLRTLIVAKCDNQQVRITDRHFTQNTAPLTVKMPWGLTHTHSCAYTHTHTHTHTHTTVSRWYVNNRWIGLQKQLSPR